MGDSVRTDYCVYTHLRPDDSVFYVGKGIPTRPYRKDGRNSAWNTEVKTNGTYVVNIVKDNLTEQEAFAVEVRLIKKLKQAGVSLTNLTRGGDGCKELVFTDEIKQKLKLSRSKQVPPMLGKVTSKETKLKISLANAGEKNGMYGKKHTEETKAKFAFRTLPTLLEQTCPHCGKHGKGGSMVRWHMDNCKTKVI